MGGKAEPQRRRRNGDLAGKEEGARSSCRHRPEDLVGRKRMGAKAGMETLGNVESISLSVSFSIFRFHDPNKRWISASVAQLIGFLVVEPAHPDLNYRL